LGFWRAVVAAENREDNARIERDEISSSSCDSKRTTNDESDDDDEEKEKSSEEKEKTTTKKHLRERVHFQRVQLRL
tara:strand:- start:597 stop:824 length:228 start_codon:yes stop_codon:yes gene_type:complete